MTVWRTYSLILGPLHESTVANEPSPMGQRPLINITTYTLDVPSLPRSQMNYQVQCSTLLDCLQEVLYNLKPQFYRARARFITPLCRLHNPRACSSVFCRVGFTILSFRLRSSFELLPISLRNITFITFFLVIYDLFAKPVAPDGEGCYLRLGPIRTTIKR